MAIPNDLDFFQSSACCMVGLKRLQDTLLEETITVVGRACTFEVVYTVVER